jgi:hypothetical protein
MAMLENAKKFYVEMAPFLTSFERGLVKELIVNPVRNRPEGFTPFYIQTSKPDINEKVKKFIALSDTETKNKKEWLKLASNKLKETTATIETAIEALDAQYDAEIGRMTI